MISSQQIYLEIYRHKSDRKLCMMVLYYRWFIYSASQFLYPAPQYGQLRFCFLRDRTIRWCSRSGASTRFGFSFILEFIPIASDRIQMRQRPGQGDMKHSSNSSILSHLSGFSKSLYFYSTYPPLTLAIARWLGLTASQSTPTCSQCR